MLPMDIKPDVLERMTSRAEAAFPTNAVASFTAPKKKATNAGGLRFPI